jgi:murein DD-endopeptidase MepM/ murein hydrolase activator NlpD
MRAAWRLLGDARMLVRPLVSAVIAIAASGCLAAAGEDADPDRVGEAGKLPFPDGSVDAFRALRIANALTAASLQHDVKLTASAARAIVARRAGADGVDGTADDRPFYTLAELDAVRDVGTGSLNRLAAYGRAHGELLGARLRIDALPPELAGDPSTVGMLTAMAQDSSLMIDGDASTLLAGEWEQAALFAHHFNETTAARVARLRSYLFGSDVRRGPFLDVVTIDRAMFGEGETSWALAALLRRTAADPRHTVGRIYAPELEAALADAGFVAQFPGIGFVQQQYLAIWNAQIALPDPGDPGDLPLDRARARALLQSRGVAVFSAPYPADRAMPDVIAAAPVAMPFAPGTEITCMQGNNSMAANSSHGPDQLRYSLDLDAPFATDVVASAAGTAYVYDHGRPNSFDNFGFGNILIIDLHNGYALLHAHMSSFAVANGQSVVAGQRVGAVGMTGAAGAEPHVHLEVVRLFRTPDPAHEEYQSDTPLPKDTPFGSPEPFLLRAIDLTAGDTAGHAIASTAIVGGESGWLPGAAHVYRTP